MEAQALAEEEAAQAQGLAAPIPGTTAQMPVAELIATHVPKETTSAGAKMSLFDARKRLAKKLAFGLNRDKNCAINTALFSLLIFHSGVGLRGDVCTLWKKVRAQLNRESDGNRQERRAQMVANHALIDRIVAGLNGEDARQVI